MHLHRPPAPGPVGIGLHRERVDVPYIADIAERTLRLDRPRPDLKRLDRPQQHAAVTLGDMAKLEPHDIIGVILGRIDIAAGLAEIGQRLVLNGPDVLEFAAGEGPPIEVLVIKQQLGPAKMIRQVLQMAIIIFD